jgi:hypothetical protein
MALVFDNLRVGKNDYLQSFGEVSEFYAQERLSTHNFKLKDCIRWKFMNCKIC